MKKERSLFVIFFLIVICTQSFAKPMPLHGQWRKKGKSISMNIPIKASIDETSEAVSLEFLEYIGEVFLTVVDLNGDIVYEEAIDTQCVSFYTISLDRVTSGSYRIFISESGNYAEGYLNL